MAKKFVRGITDIKNIEHQDFDTNNVNDLLSDGKHNYIHRKKSDGSEEYHNLTNNLKTIQSDDTDLVSVTNYNNTTNSATIRPKHDSQKEQVLESTDNTILINHGENGTDETTNLDVNIENLVEYFAEIFQVKTQTYREEYTHTNAVLHTQVTPLLDNYWDFYLFLNMHKGQTQATFELMSKDKKAFTYLINQYGENNKLDINGVEFTLNNYVLSVTTTNATNNPFLTSFSTLVVRGVS